ncbi:tigger transposable element-derived protein 2-like [Schistocerca gregaria]|uniref:tigger transposable element-derived protein 2-like n=1 Tax=Schistocerca gregaria TaxID=7010 RepID=UPI00211DAD69|nr:tigger transposable element-derived protein 2-like [Schistocerca gregaria]
MPSHPSNEELCDREIAAKLLLPNVTPILLIYRKQYLRRMSQDDSNPLVDTIEKTNVKDVVYWAAQAWQNILENTLRKSWRKLWTSLEFQDNLVANEEENLLQMIQTISGCEGASEGDIDEWKAADGACLENLTDADLVAAVTQDKEEVDCCDGSDNEYESDKGEMILHSDAAEALDLMLRYLEQQPTVYETMV